MIKDFKDKKKQTINLLNDASCLSCKFQGRPLNARISTKPLRKEYLCMAPEKARHPIPIDLRPCNQWELFPFPGLIEKTKELWNLTSK